MHHRLCDCECGHDLLRNFSGEVPQKREANYFTGDHPETHPPPAILVTDSNSPECPSGWRYWHSPRSVRHLWKVSSIRQLSMLHFYLSGPLPVSVRFLLHSEKMP